MAGNSKPRKKYNPQKRFQRIDSMAAGATHNVAATIIAKTSSMTGDNLDGLMIPRAKRDMIAIQVLAGLSILRERWCSSAFRSQTHWFRALNYLGQILERKSALHASMIGKRALDELTASDDDSPVLTDAQYRNLRLMVLELLETLAFTPAKTLLQAEMASRARFVDALVDEYFQRPESVRAVMAKIIKGASLASCMPPDMDELKFRATVKELGWVLHGLIPNSCLYKFPQSLTDLRAIRSHALPVIEKLEANRPLLDVPAELEEKAAA